MARKKISKSKRIQDFLGSNPEARNREVVEALTAYSVTAADVSNAKSQMKKKLQSAESPSAASASVGTKRSKVLGNSKSTSSKNSASTISLEELELTAGYIKAVGGLSRSQELLQMVQQIQAM